MKCLQKPGGRPLANGSNTKRELSRASRRAQSWLQRPKPWHFYGLHQHNFSLSVSGGSDFMFSGVTAQKIYQRVGSLQCKLGAWHFAIKDKCWTDQRETFRVYALWNVLSGHHNSKHRLCCKLGKQFAFFMKSSAFVHSLFLWSVMRRYTIPCL